LAEKVHQENIFASFTTSFLAILVSEIGDKTFFLAMIWAMKYPKWIVFVGSYGALAVMTILSTIFGKILPEILSKFVTDIIVTCLFFYFGLKMIYDAYNMKEE
jgi:Ca2+/H+ antiporter, TMEM165/GDT1 family